MFKSRGHKGVTLVELVILVAILLVLAIIVVPSYTQYDHREKLANMLVQLSTLQQVVSQSYHAKRNNFKAANCGLSEQELSNPHFYIHCQGDDRSFEIMASNLASVGLGKKGEYEFSVNQIGEQQTHRYAGNTLTPPLPCWVLSPENCI